MFQELPIEISPSAAEALKDLGATAGRVNAGESIVNSTPGRGAASVRAEITFVDEVEGTPINYFDVEPPRGVAPRFATRRATVVVENARHAGELSFSWEHEGFLLREDDASVVADFHDPSLLTRVYYPAIEHLVRQVTGARRVIVFDHTHRSSGVTNRTAAGADSVVVQAHNDYTMQSGPERVREMLARLAPDEDIAGAMSRRYAIINVWRPTNGSVEQWPLAVCDRTTIAREDFVAAELRWRHRNGYVAVLRHNPNQRWLYFPRMHTGEALLFTCFDSAGRDGRFFAAHTAFDDPTSPRDARVRESLEVRTIALF